MDSPIDTKHTGVIIPACRLCIQSNIAKTENQSPSKIKRVLVSQDPSTIQWSGRLDSNQRPLDPQSSALPSCATSRNCFGLFSRATKNTLLNGKRGCKNFFKNFLRFKSEAGRQSLSQVPKKAVEFVTHQPAPRGGDQMILCVPRCQALMQCVTYRDAKPVYGNIFGGDRNQVLRYPL